MKKNILKQRKQKKGKYNKKLRWWYAVKIGRNPGVYKSWKECRKQIISFPYARYKKFTSYKEATEFCLGISSSNSQQNLEQLSEEGWIETSSEKCKSLIENVIFENKQRLLSIEKDDEFSENEFRNENVIHVWIAIFIDSFNPRIGLLFSEKENKNKTNNQQTNLNNNGNNGEKEFLEIVIKIYDWKGPITKTRLGVYACIQAISIISQKYSNKKLVIFHTNSKYLEIAINKKYKYWNSIKNFLEKEKIQNNDLFIYFSEKIEKSKFLKFQLLFEKNENSFFSILYKKLTNYKDSFDYFEKELINKFF